MRLGQNAAMSEQDDALNAVVASTTSHDEIELDASMLPSLHTGITASPLNIRPVSNPPATMDGLPRSSIEACFKL
jgi:hypothetical protein